MSKEEGHVFSITPSTRKRRNKVLAISLKICIQILAFGLYMILVPLVLLIVSPLYVYRILVHYLAKLVHPDWDSMMSPRDAIVGLENITKTCECMLTVSLVCEGTICLNDLRTLFQTRILDDKSSKGEELYKRLWHYFQPWMGFTFWRREKEFSLNSHIKYCEETESLLASGGSNNNGTVTEKDMLSILNDLSQKTFPLETSPWELLIIRNYEPQDPCVCIDFKNFGKKERLAPSEIGFEDRSTGKFLLLFRIHHALADGYSILKLLCTKVCNEPSATLPQPPVSKSSCASTFLLGLNMLLFTPYYHLRQFVIDVDRNGWHSGQLKLTHKVHMAFSERISLDRLKGIAKKQQVSLTVLILALWGGAFHRFLETARKDFKIPKYMRALAPMPWAGHPFQGLINHW